MEEVGLGLPCLVCRNIVEIVIAAAGGGPGGGSDSAGGGRGGGYGGGGGGMGDNTYGTANGTDIDGNAATCSLI